MHACFEGGISDCDGRRAIATITSVCGLPRSCMRLATAFRTGLWQAAANPAYNKTWRKYLLPLEMTPLPRIAPLS
ncbi:hypothetical protein GFGA_2d0080 (plasmid) [Gluconobacter frateurii NBRC 103465]|nr:hypothetical protein GFGA_2d0080 [Gluconobacter frateurii NBRC 103465]